MTANDVDLLVDMLGRLSEHTREMRFVMPRRRFTLAEAELLLAESGNSG